MVMKFEVGKTYIAGWQKFPYKVISRTNKTVVFEDYYDNTIVFRRKIKTYQNDGSEYVDCTDVTDCDIIISSENVKECNQNL